MRFFQTTILIAVVQISVPLVADDEAPAPAPSGEHIESFQVKDCTGPAAGKTLCYACRYAGRPVVAVFAEDLDGDVMRLVKRVDNEVVRRQKQRMAAFVVLLTDDTSKTEQQLKDLAREHRIQRTPLTIYRGDPKKLQADYGLAPTAAANVVIWRDWKIADSQAFNSVEFGEEASNQLTERISKAFDQGERQKGAQ